MSDIQLSPYERARRSQLRYEALEWVFMVVFILVPVVGSLYVEGDDRINANYMILFAAGYLFRAVFMRVVSKSFRGRA